MCVQDPFWQIQSQMFYPQMLLSFTEHLREFIVTVTATPCAAAYLQIITEEVFIWSACTNHL